MNPFSDRIQFNFAASKFRIGSTFWVNQPTTVWGYKNIPSCYVEGRMEKVFQPVGFDRPFVCTIGG